MRPGSLVYIVTLCQGCWSLAQTSPNRGSLLMQYIPQPSHITVSWVLKWHLKRLWISYQTGYLLSWTPGGAKNSLTYVHNMGISYSRYCADRMIKFYPINQSLYTYTLQLLWSHWCKFVMRMAHLSTFFILPMTSNTETSDQEVTNQYVPLFIQSCPI